MTTPGFIQMKCPNLACGKVLSVPASTRGKTVRCGGCRSIIRVPEKPGSAPRPKAAN